MMRRLHVFRAMNMKQVAQLHSETEIIPGLKKLFCRKGFLALRKETQTRLVAAQRQLQLLDVEKQKLDSIARAYPNRYVVGGLTYLVAQNTLLFHWVYVRFDWNLVEPITYLLGYSVVWLGIAMWFATGKDFTYNGLRAMVEDRKKEQLYKQANFDVDEYLQLQKNVEELEKLVKTLSVLK